VHKYKRTSAEFTNVAKYTNSGHLAQTRKVKLMYAKRFEFRNPWRKG